MSQIDQLNKHVQVLAVCGFVGSSVRVQLVGPLVCWSICLSVRRFVGSCTVSRPFDLFGLFARRFGDSSVRVQLRVGPSVCWSVCSSVRRFIGSCTVAGRPFG